MLVVSTYGVSAMKFSVDEMLARARAAAKAGEPRRGRQILREILARFPSNPRARAALLELDTLVARGNVPMEAIARLTQLQAQGRHAEVLASRDVLVGRSAGSPAIFNLVGISQAMLGHLDSAAASFDHARAADPEYFDAWNNLGNALVALGRSEEAAAAYGEASKLRPDNADAHANLATAFLNLGRHADALEGSERAASLNPSHVEAHASRAAALLGLGRPAEALASTDRALALQPDHARAHLLRGVALHGVGRLIDALAEHDRAIELETSDADSFVFRANVLEDLRRLDDALASLDRAVSINPRHALAMNNRGNVLMRLGRVSEAARDFAAAADLLGDAWPRWRGNAMLVLNYLEEVSPQQIAQAHRDFAAVLETRVGPSVAPSPARDPDRRIRIGYVSADFRTHSVGYFIEGVLSAHARQDFEVFAYANQRQSDAATDRMRSHVHAWRDVAGMDDAEMTAAIRSDGIDVLVDLSGYSAGNRLPVFARRPAPVQATWIGYPQTTGLSCMDWIIADPVVLPAIDEPLYRERVMRLPGCYLCWSSPPTPRTELPALSRGHVTFASFNAIQKVSRGSLAAWAKILNCVPRARLLLKSEAFGSSRARDSMRSRFAALGGDPDRLDLDAYLAREEHFRRFTDVDIMLDPFPYNGCTSTVEALAAGVPVVGLRGRGGMMTRSGETLLTACGLPDWVAGDMDAYVDIAVARAFDLSSLAETRQHLEVSAIADAGSFTRGLERAYRAMWRDWCARSC